MSKIAKVNVTEVEKQTIGNGKNFSAKVARLSGPLGMKALGCGVVELAPGEKAWPYHQHFGLEELFVVLSGNGSIRYNDKEYPVTAGDIIFTPPGDGTAHQIINTSDAILEYLAISSAKNPEFCYYPDSGKYAAYAQNPDGEWTAFVAHESHNSGYYEGEDN